MDAGKLSSELRRLLFTNNSSTDTGTDSGTDSSNNTGTAVDAGTAAVL